MIQSNYHIHSTYCDGEASILEMAQAAQKEGLKSIGFTSHLPLKYPNDWTMSPEAIPNYFLEIKNTQDAYEGIM
ncbi:MAG: PHP domain-containing protein, partial [Eubacterium sp.]